MSAPRIFLDIIFLWNFTGAPIYRWTINSFFWIAVYSVNVLSRSRKSYEKIREAMKNAKYWDFVLTGLPLPPSP